MVRDIGWGVIDIVVHESRVFFKQRWKYDWLVRVPMADWTYEEKRSFHTTVDKQIWASWSNRVTLSVSGTSDFARRFSRTLLPINLDVRWVLRDEHWNVSVWKVPNNAPDRAEVFWNTRRINLYSIDLAPTGACTSATPAVCSNNFRTVPHEFGHAVGNTAVLNRGDEYNAGSPHLADTNSIMNIGRQLRVRHFTTLLEEMNKMIPNTTFAVHHTG
jgi:hypothetical protein